jgi:hypothetical protein
MKYGAKYTKDVLEAAAARSFSIAGVLRELEIPWSGGMHAHISRRLKALGVDMSHFTGAAHNRGGTSPRRLRAEEILCERPPGGRRARPELLRRALVEVGVRFECAICGIGPEWQGQPLILHVDHVNGDICDSRRQNLRFLCPNCHTQTFTYAGRAKNRAARLETSVEPEAPGG